MSTRTRLAATVLAVTVIAAAGLLAACQKPTPKVTFQSGSTSVQAPAAGYCFDAGHCRTQQLVKVPTIAAARGGSVLVNVPRAVATQHWIVSAFTVDSSGRNTPVQGAGSAGVLGDTFASRVFVPLAGGDYFLRVTSLRGTATSGSWTVKVAISN